MGGEGLWDGNEWRGGEGREGEKGTGEPPPQSFLKVSSCESD